MSAVILRFPKPGRLPRAAVEAIIEQLIDLLDDQDTPTMDREPEVEEESDGMEAVVLPDRHGTSSTAPVLRLVSGDHHSSDALLIRNPLLLTAPGQSCVVRWIPTPSGHPYRHPGMT